MAVLGWRKRAAGALGAAVLLGACDFESSVPEYEEQLDLVLSEHRLTSKPGRPNRTLGEDCTHFGASECTTGVCLHFGALPSKGFACSQACDDGSDCPAQWACTSLYPGPKHAFCVPPSDWRVRPTAPVKPRAASR